MSIEQVRSRLDFMDFNPAQRRTVAAVRPIMARLIGPALERFYAQVRGNKLTARFFRDRGHMDTAKSAQQSHWMQIAGGEFDESFYKSVRRIGPRARPASSSPARLPAGPAAVDERPDRRSRIWWADPKRAGDAASPAACAAPPGA